MQAVFELDESNNPDQLIRKCSKADCMSSTLCWGSALLTVASSSGFHGYWTEGAAKVRAEDTSQESPITLYTLVRKVRHVSYPHFVD